MRKKQITLLYKQMGNKTRTTETEEKNNKSKKIQTRRGLQRGNILESENPNSH